MTEGSRIGFDAVLVTCEHAGNHVPPAHRALFAGHDDLLTSHRGHDPGALELARAIAGYAGAPLVFSMTTRLLVDLNRPPRSRSVFSAISRVLPATQRTRLLDEHHRPHWDDVFARVGASCGEGRRLLHLGCHSFTPVWHGVERDVDLGLLYDPAREAEKRLCTEWAHALALRLPELRVRRNRPYLGSSQGLTTSLREAWSEDVYLGVEIEMSQRLVGGTAAQRRRVHRALWEALAQARG